MLSTSNSNRSHNENTNRGAHILKCQKVVYAGMLSLCLIGSIGCSKATELCLTTLKKTDKYLTLHLDKGMKMTLVLIPAGTFMMGAPATEEGHKDGEGPHRKVDIPKPFYMGVYEVTQEQYTAVIGSNPSHFNKANNPTEEVSWRDAAKFCHQLSLKTGRMVRLPTEAEWEYACRAGTTTPFHTGQTIGTDQANYDGNHKYGSGKKGKDRNKTIAVGTFDPNSWGLYDMHGNVWEWCAPKGPNSGRMRALRGGSFDHGPSYCRAAHSYWEFPGFRYKYSGLRVVVSYAE